MSHALQADRPVAPHTPAAEMLRLLRTRRPGFTLPQPLYNDPALFELDLQAIFHREWIFAGAECELAGPGSFFTMSIGRTPIILLRDRAGEIRAFFNVCRHRGSVICEAERGRMTSLVCPYHNWTYGLNGELRNAAGMHADFDLSAFPLRPVHVARVAGTLYVCLADEPPDIAPLREALEPFLAPHDLTHARLAHEEHLVERGNWKLVMENSRECYHCPGQHPELMRTFLDKVVLDDPALTAFQGRCEAMGLPSVPRDGPDFRVSRLPFMSGASSITMDGKPAVGMRLGGLPENEIGSVRWVYYPSCFNHVLADYAALVRMLPIGPEETLVTTKFLVHADAQEGRDYDRANLVRVWNETNDQDRIIVERNQRGVNALGYSPGPYSQVEETGLIKFTDWYAGRMIRHLERTEAA